MGERMRWDGPGFVSGEHARGFATCRNAKTPARRFRMRLNRILTDVEDAGHLLGLEMLGHQAENLSLTWRQGIDSCSGFLQNCSLAFRAHLQKTTPVFWSDGALKLQSRANLRFRPTSFRSKRLVGPSVSLTLT